MKVYLPETTDYRIEPHGYLFYTAIRDDFFYADWIVSRAIAPLLRPNPTEVPPELRQLANLFVGLDILAESGEANSVVSRAFSGRGLIGKFPDRIAVSAPLLVNCFTTGLCPLRCRYCHAEDLMTRSRRLGSEPSDWIRSVIKTALRVPAMVCVLTGGDPFASLESLEYAIGQLRGNRKIVIDTSGYNLEGIRTLLPQIRESKAHVRISLDSFNERDNDTMRLVGVRGQPVGGALSAAWRSLEFLLREKIPLSVQSVVTRQTADAESLTRTRDALVEVGVKTWVLHIFTPAGQGKHHPDYLQGRSRTQAEKTLRLLVSSAVQSQTALDIRITDATSAPNSILLIGPDGTLFTEGSIHEGKTVIYRSGDKNTSILNSLFTVVDPFGHTKRYLNLYVERGTDRFVEDKLESAIPNTLFDRILAENSASLETEIKLRLSGDAEVQQLVSTLESMSSVQTFCGKLTDTYFDDGFKTLQHRDFVVRLRAWASESTLNGLGALKGPRVIGDKGQVERVEIEIPTSIREARKKLLTRFPVQTWLLAKFTLAYQFKGVQITFDFISSMGWFCEIEGPLGVIESAARSLGLEGRERIDVHYGELVQGRLREQGKSSTNEWSLDAGDERRLAVLFARNKARSGSRIHVNQPKARPKSSPR